MPLELGQQVKAELLQVNLTVKKKLGEGTQGDVYLVEGSSYGPQALKWYRIEQATDEQKSAIQYLVQTGAPRGVAGRRFIWPLDLATRPEPLQFGYLMPLIDTRQFAELGEVWAHRKPAPSLGTLCEISYQLANSYRALHLSGHCYRDISAGNLMFDPKSGDALICDNDNVGINRHSKCQVWGTMEYMAPEIITGKADPSTETDLHSLAVLLFHLWIWHHPMHGELEYRFRAWDLPAKRRVYGLDPVFIFDPSDQRNRLPNDPEYSTARKRWGYCPKMLQDLFTRAFTLALKKPGYRVTEGEWQSLFLQLKDGAIACPNDHAENVWEPGAGSLNCWHCGRAISLPPKLVFTHPGGKHYVLLNKNAKILKRHVTSMTLDDEGSTTLGEVVQNPDNPQVWGIRNVTDAAWTATLSDGTTVEVAPRKARSINTGLKLNIRGVSAEVVS